MTTIRQHFATYSIKLKVSVVLTFHDLPDYLDVLFNGRSPVP